jgi:signal transduction histidine kinase
MENNEMTDLKNAFTGKAGAFLAISVLLLLLAFFLNRKFAHDLNDLQAITAKVQDVLHEKEKKMDRLAGELLELDYAGNNARPDSVVSSDLYDEEGFTFFVNLNDSLVFWSDNNIPYEKAWSATGDTDLFIRLQDGWYLKKSQRTGAIGVTGIILVKKEYRYQNSYLENEFQKDFPVPDEIELGNCPGSHNVFSLAGDCLFSLVLYHNIPLSEKQSLLLFAISLVSLIFLLSSMYLFYIALPFLKNKKVLMLLAFTVDVILIRIIFRGFEWPEFLYETKLFSPYFFATSWAESSLADLLVNRIMLLVVAYAIFREYRLSYINLGLRWRYLIHAAHIFVAASLYFILFRSIKELVQDSSMLMNLNDISNVDLYSLIGFSAFTASVLAYFFISTAFLWNTWENSGNKKEYLVVAVTISFIVIIGFTIFKIIPCHWPVCLLFMVYILSFNYFFGKSDTIYQLPAIVFFMIVFAVSSTFMLNHYNKIKELESRKIVASTLTAKRDPLLEYEFLKLEEKIRNDSIVNNYFHDPVITDEEEDSVIGYIEEQYFTSFWNRYERLITACSDKEVLSIQPGNYLVNCYEYFDNLVKELGVPTGCEKLYYIDNQSENNNYIAVLSQDNGPNKLNDRRIYIELYYKFMTETGLGYPELLIDKEINVENQLSGYSYARYYNNKLVYKFGDYFYHMDFSPYSRETGETYYLDKDGYNHYIVKSDENNSLVISIKKSNFFDIVAPFSYLFLFFSIFLLAFISILFLSRGKMKMELNFRNRFQVAIISIIILSLIILGFITRAYIIDLNNKKNIGYLSEKTYSVLVELEHKLGDYDSIPVSEEGYVGELLYKFAQVFFSDINLYHVNGDLIASSRPQIFEENLLSRKMNRKAYAQLALEKSLLYIHNEQIGKQEYLSAYIPFRNNRDLIVAYLNLPYFAKQDEMREEIADFISAYINIYVLLIVLAILITILVSRYVTQPLKLIREKLRNLSYSQSNEKIEWKREDEIGELVAEYNRTLDELAHSAELLARSERESAWREMAKQVAHEIKNPLTPMKLSVQYLKKAWDEKAPGWEQRLDRFSATIIEQIDSLSRIASEFSDFAKMPVASYEKIDLLEKVRRSADLFRDVENVKITVNSEDKHYYISADREQMLRVFNNLINNSVQAIGKKEDGRIDITLSTVGNSYKVEITDNGSGISEEQAERIFSPSFTTKSSGMGLGLAMVRNILSGIGASISFTSEEGVGTTFALEIPALEELR